MTTKGTLLADALELSRMEVDLRQMPPKFAVTAALVNTEKGSTHAWLTGAGVQWSKETADALRHLKECIERDLAKVHFIEVEVTEATTSDVWSGGLSEHLGVSEDVPSI